LLNRYNCYFRIFYSVPSGNSDTKKEVVIMEERKNYVKRTLRDYSMSFKLSIVKEIESGELSIIGACRKYGIVNPESNYCFGEGGAGTYSDGKLYTRSTKRGNVLKSLQWFHYFGAIEKILQEAHPHIGTNKLPGIITKMREAIIECGGEVLFNSKVTDILLERDSLTGVRINNEYNLDSKALILATGHSARDIFELLERKGIFIEAKPFALGVRIEHPQKLIDSIQY